MSESIIWLWPHTDFRYLRCSLISVPAKGNDFLHRDRHRLAGEGTATVGYSVAEGQTVRVFWLLEPTYDGIDPPAFDLKTLPPYTLVDPQSVEPNEEAKPWQPLRVPSRLRPRLTNPPIKLERKWQDWTYRHRERVVTPPGRFARLVARFRAMFRRKKKR